MASVKYTDQCGLFKELFPQTDEGREAHTDVSYLALSFEECSDEASKLELHSPALELLDLPGIIITAPRFLKNIKQQQRNEYLYLVNCTHTEVECTMYAL